MYGGGGRLFSVATMETGGQTWLVGDTDCNFKLVRTWFTPVIHRIGSE